MVLIMKQRSELWTNGSELWHNDINFDITKRRYELTIFNMIFTVNLLNKFWWAEFHGQFQRFFSKRGGGSFAPADPLPTPMHSQVYLQEQLVFRISLVNLDYVLWHWSRVVLFVLICRTFVQKIKYISSTWFSLHRWQVLSSLAILI
jgi:hypothetical protein